MRNDSVTRAATRTLWYRYAAAMWVNKLVIGLGLCLVTGCGAQHTSGLKMKDVGPDGSAAAAGPDAPDSAIGKKQRIGSEKHIDRRSRTGLAADTLDQVNARSAKPPKTSAEIYKSVAPATVIVRVGGGFGSGVVIDKAGWVLTNHHVIAAGATDDFKIKATVQLGKLSKKTGAMEREDKKYEAWVHKADKLRDIALLKIVDPPKGLNAVTVSRNKPVPGTPVVALGHAGAGMLWALKSGQVSALGKLSEALAELANFKDDEEGKKALEAFKKYVEGKNLGTIIQSTCNILPGDSGGPLLNDRGELVGLNVFARRDPATGGLLSFHVHLNELRSFVKKLPPKPAQQLPDPWLEGGGDLSLEDVDLDGRVDVMMMQGRKPCRFCPRQSTAVFLDIDQSTFASKKPPADLHDVFDNRAFDAEVIYLQLERNTFVWYDSNDDGRMDKLLYDEGTTGLVSGGYTIDKDGSLARKDAWDRSKPIQVALLDDEGLRERLARITRVTFPARYTDAPTPLSETLPDPVGKLGTAEARDLNRDGQNDALDITTMFSKRMLIDADQNFVPGLRQSGIKMREIGTSRLDPEIAIVSQSTHMWLFYDTDDDGVMDLALHAPGSRIYTAVNAWNLDGNGGRTKALSHIGRKLIRPALLGSQAGSVRSMVTRGLLSIMSAKEGDGLSSFPDPIADHRGSAMTLMDITNAKNAIVAVHGRGSDGYLIDLDRSSGLFGAADKIDIEGKVADGKFDSEFAYFQRNGVAWTYYDSDKTKGFDIVLVSLQPSSGDVAAGYRINGDAATRDEALSSGKLVRPGLFESQMLKQRLKTMAKDLFANSMVGN